MAKDTTINLIHALYNGTLDGRTIWKRMPSEGEFLATFSKYSVKILEDVRTNDRGEEEMCVILQILDLDGELIDEILDTDFKANELSTEMTPFQYMLDLYENARRAAMGIDEALSSIIEDLHKVRN